MLSGSWAYRSRAARLELSSNTVVFPFAFTRIVMVICFSDALECAMSIQTVSPTKTDSIRFIGFLQPCYHLECGCIDHVSVAGLFVHDLFPSFVDLLGLDDLDLRMNLVVRAVVDHLLGFLH